jgi:uncharacterized cupin superfamily protein
MRDPVVLKPGEGRDYPLGLMRAVFKADGAETGHAYSISEWILQPGSPGPGVHAHETEDDAFYVLEGTVTFILDGAETEAPAGSFVLASAGVRHDFENRTDKPARLLNFYSGEFEKDMPMIAQWYRENPAKPL